MQLSSPGPAAAGRLHPPLHLGVMKAGCCWEFLQRDGQGQSLQQLDRWRLLLTSTGSVTRTPSVWESLLESLPVMATADFYADMFRLNQPNIFRAEVVTFGWLGVAGAEGASNNQSGGAMLVQ